MYLSYNIRVRPGFQVCSRQAPPFGLLIQATGQYSGLRTDILSNQLPILYTLILTNIRNMPGLRLPLTSSLLRYFDGQKYYKTIYIVICVFIVSTSTSMFFFKKGGKKT